VVALGGVVVDDVHDHLNPGRMKRLDHRLELAQLLTARPGRAVGGVGREVADRAVAPVVGQPLVDQKALVGDVMDRQELDGGDSEIEQIGDGGLAGQARVGAAQPLRHLWVAHRETLDMGLIDDRL
jgi:hypothetical protein